MKAIKIKWDIDLEDGKTHEEVLEECELPTEVEIPEGINEEDISDWLSDEYGFCHAGFKLVD